MKIKRVAFYNKAHVGDLHLTRQYVKMFPKWFPAYEFIYLHSYSPDILKDIEIPIVKPSDVPGFEALPHEGSGVYNKDSETIFLNTWVYSCGNFEFCTFQSGEKLMELYFNWLVKNEKDKTIVPDFPFPKLLPSIDYRKAGVDVEKILQYFQQQKVASIFLCNNYSRNNQAYSDNLNFFALKLANIFDVNICLTNKVIPILSHSKIVYIEEIFNLQGFSLNSLSYFSTYCPVIIGRGSGPFTFSEVIDNLDKVWISMTFPHVGCDVFNGLHKYPNMGKHLHTQEEDLIISELKKVLPWK